MRREDEAAVRAFLEALSPDATRLRFFSGAPDLQWAARHAIDVDYGDRDGLVATTGKGRVVAHAEYVRAEDGDAEVAFAVADEYQGRGLGTILLAHLAESAAEHGIERFSAEVLPENYRMLEVFRESGFASSMHVQPGSVAVESATSISEDAVRRFERRDQIAASAAVQGFLAPASVAVIGASDRRGTVGGELLHNLLAGPFTGRLHAVNRHGGEVQGLPALRSIRDVEEPVELAVIAVPAADVPGVARECAAKGVHSLVVISAGFGETGPEGAKLQNELLGICRHAGMRMIGPNCLGVLNTSDAVRLNATFGPGTPPPGSVGFLSQSGALGLAVIDHARALGIGLSSFVSIGNRGDVSGNDLLQYWEDDPETGVVLLYLESFGNPRRFSRLARRVGRTKPIVAVKSGRSRAGALATASHTGALVAASDVTVDALFRQAGVIRTGTLADLFDVATLLASQPLPRGGRVAIVTNAGGPGIMCADACEAEGLEVAPLGETTRTALAQAVPRAASVTNPVDLLATATPADYRAALDIVSRDPGIDAMIAIFIPPLAVLPDEVAVAVREAAEGLGRDIPVLAVFMSSEGAPPGLRSEALRVPSYAFPENAARALARAAEHSTWREKVEDEPPELEGIRREEAAAVIAEALADESRWLSPEQVARLLDCFGVPMAEARFVRSVAEAGAAAAELGGTLALKAVAPSLLHKTDAGGVALSLHGAEAVERAADEMAGAVGGLGHHLDGFVVQRMAPDGVELLVGVVSDPLFGPVLACGSGGVQTEVIADVAVRLTPVTARDARELLRSLKTYRLLEGYRGQPRADVDALEDIVLRVSALVDAHPEIVELDCNPVIAAPGGAVVVDARIRVAQPAPTRPWPAVDS